jgi:S-adenosylmethionine synthetase
VTVEISVRIDTACSPGERPVEVVERKGRGHPDTICDAIAERVGLRLSRYYLDRFGTILHHNVDKVLRCAGRARPAFGGGEVLEPIELYLAGRVTDECAGVRIPVHEIATAACREWIRDRLPEIDVDEDVRIISRLRPGSADLTRLFAWDGRSPLANDSSCGVGFAPLTDLEATVLAVERGLNSQEVRRAHPEIGTDIKVMGIRHEQRIQLTVACAFIGRHLKDMQEYVCRKQEISALIHRIAGGVTRCELSVDVNTADDLERNLVYLTVTGTSAEAGDDGEVGRGNRASGLITPYRPMSIEAVAGKNPVSHVGKLYNVLAGRMAAEIVGSVPGIRGATCVAVSQIGRPIDEPHTLDLALAVGGARDRCALEPAVRAIANDHLARITSLRDELLSEAATIC